jgi:hypothetical protein
LSGPSKLLAALMPIVPKPHVVVCHSVRVGGDSQRVSVTGATRVISRSALRDRRLVLALIWSGAAAPWRSLLTLVVSSPLDAPPCLRVVIAPPKISAEVQATVFPLHEGPWSDRESVRIALEIDGEPSVDAVYELLD